MRHAVSDILRNDGVRGLFYGAGSTALRDAPYAGIYVLLYEQMKRSLQRVKSDSSYKQPATNMLAAVYAGSLATLVTHPFDVLRVRI